MNQIGHELLSMKMEEMKINLGGSVKGEANAKLIRFCSP